MFFRPLRARHRITTLAAALLLTPVLVPSTAHAAAPAKPEYAQPHRITLVTGDVVTYEQDADGHRSAQVEAAERPDRPLPSFQTLTTPSGFFVYPSDALPLVTSGVLDRDLFNLTTLTADGRDDVKTGSIPVIASYRDGTRQSTKALSGKADLLPQTERHVTLPTVGGVGLLVKKGGAPEFWRSIAKTKDLSRLTLDRKVRVALDKSTAQIGAPAAWSRGLDGSGTTVAIVDTGIDADHPDLKGKIVDAADFSQEGDTVDRHGHGTHVASITAGTGAASGGRQKGVAPGAKLMVAKVFDGSGEGDTSQVMAGIDWAVGKGAKVVNLSLGAGVSDGADPLSQQLDKLTEQTGTLFVVAAGNSGPGDRTVTTPGAAVSALTVGAVDDANKLAWFSSRGPRLRDALVKPEISAPGVDIVAARASGTSMGTPVDDLYTSASGTSMATPHVAGAAAILLQQHPDWSGPMLKNALVNSAKDVGLRWFEEGAGLTDLSRAVTQGATGPATASFGRNERLPGGTPAVPRTLSYTNHSDQPLKLNLSVKVQSWDGNPPPADGVKLTETTVSIPPKSTSDVTMTVSPDAGTPGVYGGTVVANSTDGAVLRTPLSTYNAPALFPVTVRMLDSSGKPPELAVAQLVDDAAGSGNHNDPFLDQLSQQLDLVDGVGRVSVPAGNYSAIGWTLEQTLAKRRFSALSASELAVTGPTEITLDATKTVPVRIVTPTRTDQRDRTVMLRRVIPAGNDKPGFIGEAGLTAGVTDWDVWVTPSAATTTGAISLQDSAMLAQPVAELSVGGTPLAPLYDPASLAASWAGDRSVPVVFGGGGTAAELAGLDVKGKAVLVRVPAQDPDAVSLGAANAVKAAKAAGAAAVLPYAGVAGALPIFGLTSTVLPTLSLGWDHGELVRAKGNTDLRVLVRAAPDTMYNLSYLDPNGVPREHVRTVDPATLVATKTSYHADVPGLTAQKLTYAFPTGLWATQLVQGTKLPTPAEYMEYTGPGDDRTAWKRVVTLSGTDSKGKRAALSMYAQNLYRAGERTRPDEHWFRADMHSTAVELASDHPARYPATANGWKMLCGLCRGGPDPDLFIPAAQWADGGGHFTSPYESGKYFTTTNVRLFQGVTELPRANGDDPYALLPEFRLSPSSATYRLEMTEIMPASAQVGTPSTVLFQRAPRTDTTWMFTSARSASAPPPGYNCYRSGTVCSFQPLIQLEHRLPLDLNNRAPAGKPFTFETAAASHTGARGGGPVTQLKVSASADNGGTWAQAVAMPIGDGRWTVTVNHPRSAVAGGYIWLRTEARDSAGNTVTQTVQRAYALG
ncbi:S8 family serine peptidase [Amycolatopsis sp. NPDC059657]|uniref:S8 family serine peptidase n=1 Tax=Amycolatopsis sp. NPDC059657 TaxID=3346899 RepID=UPI003671F0E5